VVTGDKDHKGGDHGEGFGKTTKREKERRGENLEKNSARGVGKGTEAKADAESRKREIRKYWKYCKIQNPALVTC